MNIKHTARPEAMPNKNNERSDLERLPPEIMQQIVDHVAQDPRALKGFAATSNGATPFVNQSLKRVVPPQYQVTSSRFVEWQTQYHGLKPPIRKMLDATTGYLPCPDVFSPMDENIVSCHWAMRQMCVYAKDGWVDGMLEARHNLKYHMKQAGLNMPNTDDIQTMGYINAIPRKMRDAHDCAYAGSVVAMETLIDTMRVYAKKAGVLMPDVSQIRFKGYSRAAFKALAQAQQSAVQGHAQMTNEHLNEAQRLADIAHISLSQTEKLQTQQVLRRALSEASRHRHFGHAMHGQERRRSGRFPQ